MKRNPKFLPEVTDQEVEQEHESSNINLEESVPQNDSNEGVTTVKAKRKRKRKHGKTKPSVTDDTDDNQNKNCMTLQVPEIQRTLYMEGLPFDCSVETVREFFSETHGCTDIEDLRLPLWQDTKRLRGYGHIVFTSVETTQRALREINGQHLQGRYIQLQQAREKKDDGGNHTVRDQPEGCSKVFVKNLPYDVTEADVQEAFSRCGKIVTPGGVRLARNYTTKEPKGFGYVEFKNPEGAFAAVKKSVKADGICIKGRKVIVDYDEGRIKGSFRTEDGRNWKKVYGSGANKKKRPPNLTLK